MLLTDYQALEPFIKQNRSNKTYSARLTRWLDRLAYFTSNVNHIAGKHLALTDYLSRNPSALPQTDDAYDEEYVINGGSSNTVALANTSANQKVKRAKTNTK